ncbi:hypothetical protein, partial [Odoribacter laneus]|uniref:hypothetical protein n=1 Tax=Odoribacter laneus TaxID=626933 RepID=UPI0039926360
MELEELKNRWIILEDCLKNNEKINEHLLYTLFTERTHSAWNRLISYEVLSLVIITVIFFIVILKHHLMNVLCHGAPCAEMLGGICILGFLWQALKIMYLFRCEATTFNILQTLKNITLYKKLIRMEFLVGGIVGIFVLSIVFYWKNQHTSGFYLIPVLVFLILAVFYFWSFYRIY